MQHIYPTLHEDSIQGWQVLGELQLVTEMAPDAVVRKWLPVILSLLDLQEGFVDRVRQSAQAAISRAILSENIVKPEQIHLLVLIPENDELKNQNRGFFRIERSENRTDQTVTNHTIRFYLYQEGKQVSENQIF